MDTKIFLTTALFLGIAGMATAQITIPDNKRVNVGLTYPVSTNGMQAKEYTNCFSLNALIGLSSAETGFSLAGLSNVAFDRTSGFQIAGLSNLIVNKARGFQLAGLANLAGCSSGLEVAGFANLNRGRASGLQLAGFSNMAKDAGVQVSGFINMAANVHSQVSGGINVARKVKGVQLAGLINIADSSDYPIAIFNFIRQGEKSIGVSTDETLTSLVSFRSGGRRLYGIAGLGYNHKGQRELAAWEAGIGGHLVSAGSFRLNVEVVSEGLTDFKHGDWMKSSLRVLPAYRFGHRVELFAGPSFNYLHARNGQGEDIVGHYLWSGRNLHSYYGLFFGVTGGVAVRI